MFMGIWSFHRHQYRASNLVVFGIKGLLSGAIGTVEPNEGFQGVTDQGRLVELFRFAANSEEFEAYTKDFELRNGRFKGALIRREGLVQGLLAEGTVIVESKWGIDQRFLHLPDDQPYSTLYAYYRTERVNHLIEIHSAATKGFLVVELPSPRQAIVWPGASVGERPCKG